MVWVLKLEKNMILEEKSRYLAENEKFFIIFALKSAILHVLGK